MNFFYQEPISILPDSIPEVTKVDISKNKSPVSRNSKSSVKITKPDLNTVANRPIV